MKFRNIPIISWELSDPDYPEKNIGHSIKIPNRCMDEMLYHHNTNEPICIEIITMNDANNAKCHCIVSGNVEVSDEEIVVVPFWALSKLGVDQFSLVSIENVTNVRKAGYIKVRATSSDYVHWDGLKETLETEFSKINNVSVGVPINVFGLEFYVIELRDTAGIRMLDASLFNTDVEIDFDTPSDIEEKERHDKHKSDNMEQEIRLNQAADDIDIETNGPTHFQGKSYTLSDNAPMKETATTNSSKSADLPALCWKLQFHWYDGNQDKVRPDPTKINHSSTI